VECTAGYAPKGPDPSSWFGGIDDSARACAPSTCACGEAEPADGDCDPVHARIRLHGPFDSRCSTAGNGLILVNSSSQCGSLTGNPDGVGHFAFATVRWGGPGAVGPTPPSCASQNIVEGMAVETGPQTLCCR
jgi:hypothetical protein